MTLTQQGRQVALAGLWDRRAKYQDEPPFDNASLPAGSPMYFRCIACGAPIEVHEGWINKPDCCVECEALRRLGWLE